MLPASLLGAAGGAEPPLQWMTGLGLGDPQPPPTVPGMLCPNPGGSSPPRVEGGTRLPSAFAARLRYGEPRPQEIIAPWLFGQVWACLQVACVLPHPPVGRPSPRALSGTPRGPARPSTREHGLAVVWQLERPPLAELRPHARPRARRSGSARGGTQARTGRAVRTRAELGYEPTWSGFGAELVFIFQLCLL